MIEDHAPEKHINSFRFALKGLLHAFTTERNFRLQTILGTIAIVLAHFLSFDRFEWIVLLLTIGMILAAEIANTILETLVDLTTPNLHPKARIAKDLSAAAVLIIAFFALIIGLLLFIPHLQNLFS
ncbi:MAG: hypothetical protein A3F35_02525 [Candidatus Woykebacteria bacterium RIFCSPHIGHO2_12_FULL_45_10]|uniref:Diacylglycerol kinase n=1 Tax=Candidatus Woykebacteria bacterium RIFCSPHIGHO2_12_FULL_45_10 TaxID=1802603 RepID=A0A1G1WQ32_9BACT|nr:MAG: hypothetical protein A3F35_02525 [Candidatus Woykebacteria bacterium RIFCSPHIGHO2_12_FULL_45_10]